MRILIIGESYEPQKCGMTTVTKYLAEGLVRKGHQVTMVTCWYDPISPYHEEINGVSVFRFYLSLSLLKRPQGQIKEYLAFVLGQKADVVIVECFGSVTSDILFPHLDEIKAPKILHSHGDPFKSLRLFSLKHDLKHTIGNSFNYINLYLKREGFYKKWISHFDRVVLLSKVASDIEMIQKAGMKYDILENACDNMFFEYADGLKSGNLSEDSGESKYMISIANYTPVKNQLMMVKAYYDSNITDTKLLLIGSKKNAYYEMVEEFVKEQSLKHPEKTVEMLYGVDRDKLPKILSNASLYLVTSTFEEYSISIIEAMSLGVPFISTNAGNARILPGGKTVYSYNEFVSSLNTIMSSEELRKDYSQKGKNYANDHCRIEVAVDTFEYYIKETIKNYYE